MVMKYALYLTYTLSWISFDYSARSLTQQYADSHVAPLGHINLIPSQTVFTSVLVLKYHHCMRITTRDINDFKIQQIMNSSNN
jgi:hypothetical protein